MIATPLLHKWMVLKFLSDADNIETLNGSKLFSKMGTKQISMNLHHYLNFYDLMIWLQVYLSYYMKRSRLIAVARINFGIPNKWSFWIPKVDFLNLTPFTLLRNSILCVFLAHFVAKPFWQIWGGALPPWLRTWKENTQSFMLHIIIWLSVDHFCIHYCKI